MIELDGYRGEGGGQVLRTALALSLITGSPFMLHTERARRPGLAPHHLPAVQAAGRIGHARVEGDRAGSRELRFAPSGLLHGDFHFDCGAGGACALVVQTLLPALLFARGPSTLHLSGATHLPASPCFDYQEQHWGRYLREMGVGLALELEVAGFAPQGEGAMVVHLEPSTGLRPLHAAASGHLLQVRGVSAVAGLDDEVAERQRRAAERELNHYCPEVVIETRRLPAGNSVGSVLLLVAEFEHSRAAFFTLGERRKRAEQVAREATAQFDDFLASDGAVDPWLMEQLLLPLALARGESTLRAACTTPGLRAAAEVIRAFLPAARIEFEGDEGAVDVVVRGSPP